MPEVEAHIDQHIVPPEVVGALQEFRTAAQTGKITLDVKDGAVLSISTEVSRRVGPRKVYPNRPSGS